MSLRPLVARSLTLALVVLLPLAGLPSPAAAAPEGTLTWGIHVTLAARWLDPTNGLYTIIGAFSNTGTHDFSPPGNNAGGDPDWVLVLTACT